jgi:adenosylcobyric acid synthase
MLGRVVSDPDGIEGAPRSVAGLGLLDVETVMTGDKTLREVAGVMIGSAAASFTGYEMHVGVTTGPGCSTPFLRFADGAPDGAVSADGRVVGCYVHGLFGLAAARSSLMSSVGAASGMDHAVIVDTALDEIATRLEACLDIDALASIAGL